MKIQFFKHSLLVRMIHMLCASIILVSLQGRLYANSPVNKQDQLTAAFIYQITKFTQWPKDQFDGAEQLFTICLLDENTSTLFQYLKTLEGGQVKGRDIEVKQIPNKQQLMSQANSRCEVLYSDNALWQTISAKEAEQLAQTTLLVGGEKQFLRQGGMLALITVNNKMKIFINQETLNNSPIKLESRLKALAKPL